MATGGSLVPRMIGAARLDPATYDEVARDSTANGQAAIVVVLATVASALASWAGAGWVERLAVLLIGPTLWFVLALATGFVGTRLAVAPPAVGLGSFLRALGFAQTLGLLAVFGTIPIVGSLLAGLAFVGWIVASVVAVRQTLRTSTGRASVAVVLGLLVGTVVWLALVAVLVLIADAVV